MEEEVVGQAEVNSKFTQAAKDALNSLKNSKHYTLAIDDISDIEKSETQPDFCHYIRAKVAIKQGKIKLALEHLTQISDTQTQLFDNLYITAQSMIRDHVKEQAEKALELVEKQNYRQALRAIENIESSKTESDFCHFVRALIAKERRSPKLALKHLAQVTNEQTVLQAGLYATAQEMLVQLVKDEGQHALTFLASVTNKQAVAAITALENAQVDLNFCRFAKATIAHKLDKPIVALKCLAEITEDDSEFLPNLPALKDEMRTKLIQQQATLALNALGKSKHLEARNAITSLKQNNLEPDFCNYVEGQIAYDQDESKTATVLLTKVFEEDDENVDSVVTFDVNTTTQNLLNKIVREQTQNALEIVETRVYTKAIEPIEIIESTKSQPYFCCYIRARVDKENGEHKNALEHLARMTLPLSPDKKFLGTFDLEDATQKMLVSLIGGQLKELSRNTIPLSGENEFIHLPLENLSLSIAQSLEPFVKVSRSNKLGLRFDFTDKLSLDSQLHILENLKMAATEFSENNHESVRIFGHEMSRGEYLHYLTREQYFIKGLIYQQQELWATALACFNKAFLKEVYKEEFLNFRLFYFEEQRDFKLNPNYSFEQAYKILQSMRINELITDYEYVRWLSHLQNHVVSVACAIPVNDSSIEDHRSQASSESPSTSRENEISDEADASPPSSSAPEFEPLDKDEKDKLVTLADKIERQLLLYNDSLKTQNDVSSFIKESTLEQPKVQKTAKQLYGENITKDYFNSAWELCLHLKEKTNAALLLMVPILVVATIISPVILAHKQFMFAQRQKRNASEIAEDDNKLDARRKKLKADSFKRARHKYDIAGSKCHLLLAPPPEAEVGEMRPLEEDQLRRAKALKLSVPNSPTNTN